MRFLDPPWVKKYLIPGVIFQSVLVGGGYGTGREIVEFFTRFGAGGGILGLGVTVICWILVLTVTWEFARVFQVYDYRSFFQRLLGRGWVLFEILFILMFLLVLAVVAAAAGEILETRFGIPYFVGITAMLVVVAALTFFGRDILTKSLALWTLFLYGMFVFYFLAALSQGSDAIGVELAAWEVAPGWGVSGFQYALYNLFIVPAILFSTRALETRREVVGSAVVAAVICAFPALLFHISFLGDYPGILAQEIPVFAMITSLGLASLLAVYLVALFGTFIETGAGLIQGSIERVDGYLRDARKARLSPSQRAALAVAGIGLSAILATVGIIPLIARGYGTIAWGFLAVYVLPVLTLGIWKLTRGR